jgi:tripartite-type tricarboxylate transporter receptor subunit TctC
VIAHIKTGRLRPLGVAAARRSPTLPDVPTIAESGVPGRELSPWIGLLTPAATPRPVIERLNAEVNRALKLPEVASTLSAPALDPWGDTLEEFGARLKADFAQYGKLIAMTGARVE